MSVLNQSGEEPVECPLCMEPLEVDDLHFYPCTCGYQICRFCWNRIREGENGLCPACRKAYPEDPADFTPLSQEQVAAIKTEKRAREQRRRNKTLESRRALANVRVVQNNLVFVVGLPVRLADPEILKRQEYFGKYGKIHKVVINQSTSYAGSQGPSASAYVTYVSGADALRAIQGVNNVTLDGRVLKGSLGTTKYCANFMKNQPCPKPDCMYLHELGDPKASFTKEEMHAGLHQVYERKLHNQLLNSQKDKPDEKQTNGSGNSSTNAEKSSSKDGNQSNLIPTTVITSSNINIVNSSKSKKENSNSNNSSSSTSSNGKEAWPSLGSSPPADSPARKQASPKPQTNSVNKSQENGMSSSSESSSPTQLQTQQAQSKTKDTQHTETKSNRSNKEHSTNGQTKKKTDKTKHKSNSTSSEHDDKQTDEHKTLREDSKASNTHTNSLFDNEQQNYLTNELDELESDRHSLLENHDLLDNSDHSLLEDDNTHRLLEANTSGAMLARHRGVLANGYPLLDADLAYLDRQITQINQGMDQKELLLRDRSQSEMLMRQNEMLARQHNVMVEPKHYMPTSSIGLDNASELLGANFHPSPNMLPPFGMRVDNSMSTNSLGGSSIQSNMSSNMQGMQGNTLPGYLLQQQMLQNHQQMSQNTLVNGFDASHNSANEGRYLAENMDKFFTDFHKAQQLRQLRAHDDSRYEHYPRNMLSAQHIEMEHKQRMNSGRNMEASGRCAAGDGDDDLDFDPFKETQKAFAELMETEMLQNQVSSGDNVRRTRMAPPGFSHVNTFGLGMPRHHSHHQGFLNSSSSSSAMFSDWSQMDPAIMSVNFSKGGAAAGGALSAQQHEVFARFNGLGARKAGGWGAGFAAVPLPPGFAPPKPPQRPAECIDAK